MSLPPRQSHILKQKTGPDDPELQKALQASLEQVSPGDVIAIADELAERHRRLFAGIGADPDRLASSFADVASAVTHTKANSRTLALGYDEHDSAVFAELLIGASPAPVRIATFVERLNAVDTRLALELATGILHNILPNEHWLWTRWLWDPTSATGILPLLAGSTHNLLADNLAEGYARVGAVTAMSMKFAEGTGLWTEDLVSEETRAPFANSAFLACAYGIYVYGSTSWRLSRDFNDLLPSLPNMARRLLGLPKVNGDSRMEE